MRIQRIEPGDLASGVWEGLTGGSFFASRGFLDLWRTTGGRPVAWLAELEGVPAALIPGVEYGSGPLARFVSLPEGCYGGVFADPAAGTLPPAVSRALLDAIARRRYAKAWLFDFRATTAAHAGFSSVPMDTVLADISDPDWRPADRKLTSQIRKARREGIAVQRFDWTRHGEGFLSLVRGTARHHRIRPRYPARVYRALAGLADRDARVRWVHCEHQGRPASSHIYFVEGDSMQAWQSHFDRSLSFLKPNQYIRFAECRDAARQGVRWLNLGSTPPGAAGVAYYKARWGVRNLRFLAWRRFETLGVLVDALRAPGTVGGTAASDGHGARPAPIIPAS